MTTGGHVQSPTCELASRTELADENVVAPNGQTGAKILATVPESLHTSLHWDFSSLVTGVEVEVPGSIGLSSVLDLSFSFPSEPRFYFEDWMVVYPDADNHGQVAYECLDMVTTTLDVNMVTEDGTISLNLTGLKVGLNPDDPETDYVAKPLIYQTVAMTTPVVNFLQPEALPASTDKTIVMEFDFDGVSVDGAIIVHAEGSSATYEHLVARW
ncbi:hypothetical protein ENSA5_15360 [Enhygromyxa salina]|uniref:Uncharacterized protein n=2 Tax=Enhygromyxa salina TaxID=215803 RepID=A0A2S9YES0_9BACT|nr:hypothetical protein ENSA5_15360 [Enhygromyxa salina]